MNKTETSKANISFWNELCGSQLAKSIGIKDSSKKSLKKFDDWYFKFYPYLDKHIQFSSLNNKDVLEIGLGYGTVSEKIASSGGKYKGLDIAEGPVKMVNHRLKQNNLKGKAFQCSILDHELNDNSFDTIIAIGCLHHTGDLDKAIQNCYKLLKPGGSLIFMVYYSYSLRRWINSFNLTLKYLLSELIGKRGVVGNSNNKSRARYDTNEAGEGAPHTDWISKKSMASLCKNFSELTFKVENIDSLSYRNRYEVSREKLLGTFIPKIIGLDLYVTAKK